jgi:hypothetical protein
VARPPNSGHVHWRGVPDGVAGPFSLLTLRSSSVGRLDGDGSLTLARRREKERGESVLGFSGEGEFHHFVLPGSTHDHPFRMDDWH